MSGPMNNDPRTSTEIERDILRAGLRERDEEIARLRAVVAGDPSPRMIRTEDVARVLWPFVYAGRRDACHDEGFGPRFDDLAQTAQDLFCALIDEAMQTMGAAIKRDPAEEDRRAVAAAWMFDAFAARGKRITELAAERDTLRAEVAVWRERPDGAQMQHALDVARAEVLALRSIVEGRAVPPTPNEVEAHRATGGSWRWSVISRGLAMAGMGGTSQTPHGSAIPAGWRREDHITECWWALDREDRPCAWPVAP